MKWLDQIPNDQRVIIGEIYLRLILKAVWLDGAEEDFILRVDAHALEELFLGWLFGKNELCVDSLDLYTQEENVLDESILFLHCSERLRKNPWEYGCNKSENLSRKE